MPAGEVARRPTPSPRRCGRSSAATRLGHGAVRAYATPAPGRRVRRRRRRRASPTPSGRCAGPRVSAAFDAAGAPTKAAAGFARGQGVDAAELRRIDVGGVEHVAVVRDRRRARRGRRCWPACSPRSSPSCGPRRTCGGTTRSCRSPGRCAGWSRCSATSWCRSRCPRWRRRRDHPGPPDGRDAASSRSRAADGYLDFLADHGIVADPAVRRELIVERRSGAGRGRRRRRRPGRRGRADRPDRPTWSRRRPPLLGGFEPRYLDAAGRRS